MTDAYWELKLDDGRVEALLATMGDEAAELIAEHVLDASNRHVPHELGDLARSGRVGPGEGEGERTIYYDTPYAVVQHEDLTLQHDAGRTAKYLENAMNGEGAACQAIIERTMAL